MRFVIMAAALAACLALPADAQQFRSHNGHRVIAETPRTFSVPFQGYSDDHEFWCAASDYVRRGLGLPGRTPIFLLTELPRKRGQGLRFSLDPEGAAPRTGVTTHGGAGPKNSVSATSANSLCPDLFPDGDRF